MIIFETLNSGLNTLHILIHLCLHHRLNFSILLRLLIFVNLNKVIIPMNFLIIDYVSLNKSLIVFPTALLDPSLYKRIYLIPVLIALITSHNLVINQGLLVLVFIIVVSSTASFERSLK